jgi:hypothetical protein
MKKVETGEEIKQIFLIGWWRKKWAQQITLVDLGQHLVIQIEGTGTLCTFHSFRIQIYGFASKKVMLNCLWIRVVVITVDCISLLFISVLFLYVVRERHSRVALAGVCIRDFFLCCN